MKKYAYLLFPLIFSIHCLNAQNNQPPNILFFLIDDIRNSSLGCYDHPIIQTPNIDQLAAQGTRFTNAFVTTSICAASRASILTGQYESSHQFTFGKPLIKKELTDASFPVRLKEAGYQTGFIGKWGMKTEVKPTTLYDYFYPIWTNPYFKIQKVEADNHAKGICVDHAADFDPTFIRPEDSLRHITELCGDFAIQFIQNQNSTQPFCLQVSFNAVHAEDSDKENHYPPPKAVKGMYADVEMPKPNLNDPSIFENLPEFLKKSMNRDRYFWRWDTPEKYEKNMRDYFRMISGVDRVIGRIISTLKERGMDKNTLIIITGDNGYYMGDRGFAGKWSHFEESLRVPLIIVDPSTERAQVINQMALNIDIPSTILDYAKIDASEQFQGQSLKPLIEENQKDDWRNSFFVEQRMNHKSIPKWEGIRHEQYVYAHYYEQKPSYEFLHDLKKDPKQLVNLAKDKSYQKILQKMQKLCAEKAANYQSK